MRWPILGPLHLDALLFGREETLGYMLQGCLKASLAQNLPIKDRLEEHQKQGVEIKRTKILSGSSG